MRFPQLLILLIGVLYFQTRVIFSIRNPIAFTPRVVTSNRRTVLFYLAVSNDRTVEIKSSIGTDGTYIQRRRSWFNHIDGDII